MRKTPIKALDDLFTAATTVRNPWLNRAIESGRRIVGILYQEIPEEIITAAGCVPILLRGSGAEGTEYAEAYFRQLTCNYTRCTFNEIVRGKWDFLDGAVVYNSCDHARRIYDNWLLLPRSPVYFFLYAPKKGGELAARFYGEQVRKFLKATEERFGVTITEEKLAAAVRLHNETRRLQQQLYEMQKGEEVYLTGTELMMAMFAAKCMPREDYNRLLAELIAALRANGETMKPRVRLLYAGGHADSPEFFRVLEPRGAQFVADSTGFGSCACERLVSAEGSPLEAVTRYYFEEMPGSPRKFGEERMRMERIARLIREYSVDGVVMTRLVMCDLWAMEQFMLRDYLASTTKVPLLEIAAGYLPEGQGQIATRMQAFVESIEDAKKN